MKLAHWLLLAAMALPPISAAAQQVLNAAPATQGDVEQVNAVLAAARADNKEKRFADAEALMLKATVSMPGLIYTRLELAQAQMGLKKFDEAEANYKIVLGLDGASIQPVGQQNATAGFYDMNGGGTRGSRNTAGGSAVINTERTPEVQGIAWSNLGAIDIHRNKTIDAQSAFDKAAKIDPKDAPLYRQNETIFFFQAGNAAAQVDAADKAIALDPSRASLYYFKAQGLTAQATIDPKTQRLTLPADCTAAYRKYLSLEPSGQFANDAKTVLAASQTVVAMNSSGR